MPKYTWVEAEKKLKDCILDLGIDIENSEVMTEIENILGYLYY